MLLYHFPLTSNSTTANLENRGMRKDYQFGSACAFGSGGKMSAYSMLVNGTNQSLLLNDYGKEYSVCFRFKLLNKRSVYNTLFWGRGSNDSFTDYIQFYANNTSAYIHCMANGVNYTFDLNTWYDVVFVSTTNYRAFYINGELIVSSTAVGYSNFICIGARTLTHDNYVNCNLQDIRVYDYILSPQEIADYSKALVLHYTLNGNVNDCSGLGNNYAIISGKTYNYYSNSPRGQKYLSTNDTNVKAITTTAPTNNKSMWCKYSGVWYHLYSNGKYVNGVVNTTLYDTIYNNATELSDIRIYTTALSSTDILALYHTPITLGASMNGCELKENTTYNENAWRTPTYAEMYYIINTRTNASSLRGLGRIQTGTNTYVNGCFLLPDGFTAPSGITFTNTTSDYTTNTYTLAQWQILEDLGVVFLCQCGTRLGTDVQNVNLQYYWCDSRTRIYISPNNVSISPNTSYQYRGQAIRLCQSSTLGKFSTPNGKINFASGNLQYHCTQHIWRFAEHQYDYIGSANANISDSYNGWIDLFGYGTSGKNYSPTLHTTTNSDYASGNIAGTENDWGVNEITTNEYMAENIRLTKSGIIKANELNEGSNQLSKNGISYTQLKEI